MTEKVINTIKLMGILNVVKDQYEVKNITDLTRTSRTTDKTNRCIIYDNND